MTRLVRASFTFVFNGLEVTYYFNTKVKGVRERSLTTFLPGERRSRLNHINFLMAKRNTNIFLVVCLASFFFLTPCNHYSFSLSLSCRCLPSDSQIWDVYMLMKNPVYELWAISWHYFLAWPVACDPEAAPVPALVSRVPRLAKGTPHETQAVWGSIYLIL